MKAELPAPLEYYRLTRARELRERAARLERAAARLEWWSGCSGLFLLLVLCFLLSIAVRLLVGLDSGWLLAPAIWATLWGPGWLRGLAARWTTEAHRLEWEHQSRYGALPAGAGKDRRQRAAPGEA